MGIDYGIEIYDFFISVPDVFWFQVKLQCLLLQCLGQLLLQNIFLITVLIQPSLEVRGQLYMVL
jgi:hypothetical protein